MSAQHGKTRRYEGLAIFNERRGWVVREGFAGFPMGRPVAGPFASRDEAVAARDERVRQIRAASQRAVRACLCCGGVFASAGPHNRLCPTCSSRAAGLPAQMAG